MTSSLEHHHLTHDPIRGEVIRKFRIALRIRCNLLFRKKDFVISGMQPHSNFQRATSS